MDLIQVIIFWFKILKLLTNFSKIISSVVHETCEHQSSNENSFAGLIFWNPKTDHCKKNQNSL